MKWRFLLLISCILGVNIAKAQDNIYSQFFNAPIYLNPALTGQFEGDLRATREKCSPCGGKANAQPITDRAYDYRLEQNHPQQGAVRGAHGFERSEVAEVV